MKKVIKALALACMGAVVLFSLAGCQLGKDLDVIGKGSVASFSEVLAAIPDQVAPDEVNAGWSLAAPDGTARFIWSEDYSKSALHDVMLEVDAKPFLDAGLDASKLPENVSLYEGKLMVGTKLGHEALTYNGASTPLSAYEQIVNLKRSAIGYHTAMDHYGVNLGNGNMFEWAKDMGANDKDIVFALSPEPFIAAGVDIDAVDGWVFAKVPMMVDGKPTDMDKLLKPFDLK